VTVGHTIKRCSKTEVYRVVELELEQPI